MRSPCNGLGQMCGVLAMVKAKCEGSLQWSRPNVRGPCNNEEHVVACLFSAPRPV